MRIISESCQHPANDETDDATKQDENGKDAFLVRLAYERYENYLRSARAVLHVHQDEAQALKDPCFEQLWHLLDLMSLELNTLLKMLKRKDHTVVRLNN